jgi:hypothetical protein
MEHFSHSIERGENTQMKVRYQKIFAAIAVVVTLAITQTYIGVSFAGTSGTSATSPSVGIAAQLMGVLTTSSNKPITVNGASAVSGATIPSPATIETPAGVGATIRLGALGSLCVAPNTKLSLEFDQQGNVVNVTLLEGCAILRTPKNVAGAINGAQGSLGKTDAATGGSTDVCLKGGAPSVNQGSAVDAGAGASALDCGAAGAAALPGGLPPAATVAFIGGGIAGLYLLFRGGNPSGAGL